MGSQPTPRRIPVAGPSITQREIDAVTRAVTESWYDGANVELQAFEAEFAQRLGRRHAIALPSCTAGIHLSLLALGIGPGDEVIVPESTWIATAAPIHYVGATPVFVDVERLSWCIDPDAVRRAITPATRAVISVDLYGGAADYVALEAVCTEHGLPLIEDAAEAAGGLTVGRHVGSFGATAVFSFHGSKTLTTGEGGMVLCDDDDLWQQMLFLRDHGRLPGDLSFRSAAVGWKYKMSAMQAALGRVQLDRIDELVASKRTMFGWYADRLDGVVEQLNWERPGDRSTYWMATMVLDPAGGLVANELADALRAEAIDTRPFFPPLSSIPAFDHLYGNGNARPDHARHPVAYHLGTHGLNLPSSLRLTESDVDRVCDVVRATVDRHATNREPS